jgi:flagellar protein FlaI
MIIGGTGAGKTSMLNALTSLILPNDKIITVEEIAELNPPRQNWVQLVSRRAFRFGSSDTTSISLFDLVKVSLRYRPDYIVVGEIRGEEAYVLFQAVATGHGGLCTMHADSLDHAVKRLTSPPMNVSEVYIPLMNLCIYVARVDLPKNKGGLSFGRRIRNMWEIVDYGKYNLISEWIPSKDRFRSNFSKSFLLEKIAAMRGVKKSTILKEINERRKAIHKMLMLNMNGQEVAQAVMNYYEGKPIEAAKRSEAKTVEERKVETAKKTKKTTQKRKGRTSEKKQSPQRKNAPKKKLAELLKRRRREKSSSKSLSKDRKKKGGTKKR